ncbi:MAG: DMT family transporter [Pseudomonadota bacterium]
MRTTALSIPHTPQAGLVLVTVAFLFAPGLDVFAKLLTQTLSPGMVGFGRFAVQTILMLPIVLLAGQWIRPGRGHMAAGALLGLALLCFNAALQVMPIANAIAIFFVEPLILTVLSALILKERIGWRRILAVVIGLIGALVVIRPNWEAYGPTAILPLGTAICFAFYVLITKVLVKDGRPLALQFWTGVGAMAVLGFALVIGDVAGLAVLAPALPNDREMMLFLGMGAIAVVAHQMLVHALARVDASVVAPMQYLEILAATVFGWWIFGDFPNLWTWCGTAIIVASGIYVFHRERRVREAG